MDAFYTLISRDPCVVTFNALDLEAVAPLFPKELARKRINFVLGTWWNLGNVNAIRSTAQKYLDFTQKFPLCRITYLANTRKELMLLRLAGIPAIFCNHNCFVDEKMFKPDGTEKKYDAIYNATIRRYKRHSLASQISRLALVHYGEEDDAYFASVRDVLAEAEWLNLRGDSYFWINECELPSHLNASKVGLCLSKTEGAMYASMEYLLCGLPVVTTRNTGGRDVFFDPKYVCWVDDDAASVSEGVAELIRRKLDPEIIRRDTIEKMQPHRERFIRLIQSIYDHERAGRDFRSEWDNVFVNKMRHEGEMSAVLNDLAAG